MEFNFKKTAIVLIDCLLAVYLVLAITAFNSPDESCDTCTEVNIHVEEGAVKGFLNADEVKSILLQTSWKMKIQLHCALRHLQVQLLLKASPCPKSKLHTRLTKVLLNA